MELRRLHLAGAAAALTPRRALPPFLARPLPPYESSPIGLDQMERFLRHPVRAFLRERLNVSLRNRRPRFEDAIPIDLDALERWQIADRVLQARLAGAGLGACLAAERRPRCAPARRQLADSVLGEITGPLDELVQARASATAPESVDVRSTCRRGRGSSARWPVCAGT